MVSFWSASRATTPATSTGAPPTERTTLDLASFSVCPPQRSDAFRATRGASPTREPMDPTRNETIDELHSDTDHHGLVVAGRDFTGQCASAVAFKDCRLTRTVFARSSLHGLDLSGTILEGCDLANALWEGARLENALFVDCRVTGLDLSQASLQGTEFRSCEISMANFRNAVFKKTKFVDCKLRGADFQRADLRQAVFQGCDLREAQMSFAKLDGTDLRSSEIAGLQVGIADLRGAVVEPSQAAYLAGLMGLRIVH